MLVDLADQAIQILLNIHSFQSVMDLPGHPAKVGFFFEQINFEPLLGYTQGAGHTGRSAADHQGRLVDRQIKFLQRLQMRGPGHRHADDVLCLFCGVLLLLGVDPGAVLADIGEFEEVLVDPRFTAGVPEQRFVSSRSTGRQHQPVKTFFDDRSEI